MATKNKQEPGLLEVVQQFCSDKSLDRESVMNVIRESLVTAYKKKNGMETAAEDSVDVEISGDRVVLVIKKHVVDGDTENPLEISLEEARKIKDTVSVGENLEIREKPVDLSRIISNQAKQMVFQRLKDMEKEILYNEYKEKEGELIHGYFQRWKNRDVMSIDLGKVEGIMPKKDQNPGEKYRQGDRLKAIISRVELKPKEPIPVITLSRASGDFVKKLFEMEIPEIFEGQVEIVNVARQPSIRTKVVVRSTNGDIDPVGACVGMKGVRIQSIVRELGNERIDIVQYSDNSEEFIKNAISPAKPVEVKADSNSREALVIVNDDSLSLAIGINGSNVKLASILTKYKIDIRTVSQYNEDMTSPEAREKLDKLFNKEEEEEQTSLNDIPGLTPRVVDLLISGGINDVETLIEMSQEELASIPGIGNSTAEQIMKLLSESVEWVED